MSYSNRDRQFVEELAKRLKAQGRSVFFAPDHGSQSNLAGEDLPEALAEIYSERSLLCAPISSPHYSESKWAILELNAALARQQREVGYPYLVPVLLGAGNLPGVPDSTAHLNASEGAATVAAALSNKVKTIVMNQRGRLHHTIWIVYLAIAALVLSPSILLTGGAGTYSTSHLAGGILWLFTTLAALASTRFLRNRGLQGIVRKLLILTAFVIYAILIQLLWHPTIIMSVWFGCCLGFSFAGLWFFDAASLLARLSLPRYTPLVVFSFLVLAALSCTFVLYGQLGEYIHQHAFFQMLRIVMGFALSSAGLYLLVHPIALRPRHR